MRSLICIPTYNEIDNIRPLSEDVLAQTPEDVDILFIDDNSPDGTGKLADSLAEQTPRIHVLHREKKEGLGPAYIAGFRWGMAKDYEAFIEMDADFSHHPTYLPKMLHYLQDFDGVIGSRYVEGGGTVNWGWVRKAISRGGSLYARTLLGLTIKDLTGGFNGWRRKVLEALELESLRSDGYSFQIELKHRAALKGFRLKEFPIVFEDRKVGHSKMDRRIVVEALFRVWEFRRRSRNWVARTETHNRTTLNSQP